MRVSARRAALCAVAAAAILCAGCSWYQRVMRGDGLAGVTPVPLAPVLRFSPTVPAAAIPYQNACGEPASLPIASQLTEVIPQKLGRVFTGLAADPGPGRPAGSDGVIEIGLGLKQIDVAVLRPMRAGYPVTVTIGLDATFLADDGTVLFTKKLQSAGQGEVKVREQSCDIAGLEPVVREAVELAGEGIARQAAESIRIREFADRRKADRPAVAAVPAGAPAAAETIAENPTPAIRNVEQQTAESAPVQPVALTFRAILRDENRDQLLHHEESLTVEIEVKNDGAVEAKGIEVVLSGTPALLAAFPPTFSIGDLQPGEMKRTAGTGRVLAPKEPLQAELVLSLRSATPVEAVPLDKKFTVLIKPEPAAAGEAVADVDQPPKPAAALKQPKAVIVAIGVGRYRDEQVASVKYAGRDAEVMAGYLRALANVPEDRVRVLVDTHALKQDLAETFDEWLPKRVDPSTVVYVFFSGRALVDGVTGAVSLVPFDGTTSAIHRLYSVRRLQESLARASIHKAILMFDVSLEPAPGVDPATVPQPVWDAEGGERKDQMMWMVAHKGLQEAHGYEPARHGLFTYHLLRGLQGLADVDHDGTVVAGELCTYARSHTNRIAREQFGNEQDPLCLPPPGQGAMVRIHPMAKGNNPKPAKKEEAAPAAQNSKPGPVGPTP
ncbi:exported protein of unknown function [Nitrospira moscoviensis]|uniref:Uncharacterized protein n=2 Tax=Nitrospira moscoviensis TaxID=42253 RepID=A0A0K2G8B8_NITMO|nr:exported protein of unknown function [Nitrospira moscoviensis]